MFFDLRNYNPSEQICSFGPQIGVFCTKKEFAAICAASGKSHLRIGGLLSAASPAASFRCKEHAYDTGEKAEFYARRKAEA